MLRQIFMLEPWLVCNLYKNILNKDVEKEFSSVYVAIWTVRTLETSYDRKNQMIQARPQAQPAFHLIWPEALDYRLWVSARLSFLHRRDRCDCVDVRKRAEQWERRDWPVKKYDV